MTTLELVRELFRKDPEGNKQVIVASDEEGNSYSTLDPQSISDGGDHLVLYPWTIIEVDEE